MILRSYHVFDNENNHDPGSLDQSSDLIDAIDESVYKTFINPRGLRAKSGPFSSSVVVKGKILKYYKYYDFHKHDLIHLKVMKSSYCSLHIC